MNKKRLIIEIKKSRFIARGLLSYIPGICHVPFLPSHQRQFRGINTHGGSDTARYCYSVWLRHLSKLYEAGVSTTPKVVAEIGPGDSLGAGMAALLSGSDTYYVFDILTRGLGDRNLAIFDELVELFKRKVHIPDNNEFPKIKPLLESYDFPDHILTEERMIRALNPERIKAIRDALSGIAISPVSKTNDICIRLVVPWNGETVIEPGTVDLVFSQAVMEHIDDLPSAFYAIHSWLKKGGVSSYQVDLKCHNTADEWNGHWRYSDFIWRIIRGASVYLINRVPCSGHIKLHNENNLKILIDIKVNKSSTIEQVELARKFSYLTDTDLQTSGVYLLSVKL